MLGLSLNLEKRYLQRPVICHPCGFLTVLQHTTSIWSNLDPLFSAFIPVLVGSLGGANAPGTARFSTVKYQIARKVGLPSPHQAHQSERALEHCSTNDQGPVLCSVRTSQFRPRAHYLLVVLCSPEMEETRAQAWVAFLLQGKR